MNTLRSVWSRIVSAVFWLFAIDLWCDHVWENGGIEEIGEKHEYRCYVQCAKCGKRDFYAF